MIPEAVKFKQSVDAFIEYINSKMNLYCFETQEEYDDVVDKHMWEYSKLKEKLIFEPAYGPPERNIGDIMRMRHKESLDKYGDIFSEPPPPRTHTVLIYNEGETMYATVTTFFIADTRTYLYKKVHNKKNVLQPHFILHCIELEEAHVMEDPLYDAGQEIKYD
jgi:hypothetical protein